MIKNIEDLKSPWKFKLFLMTKLPMAYLAGIRLNHISYEKATTDVKYKFITQNPFRSLYFACQAMTAELATGILAMFHVNSCKESISMLVVGMNAKFHKRVTGKVSFTCQDGKLINDVIEECIKTKEGKIVTVRSAGIDEAGQLAAEFEFTWSFKVRNVK